MKIFISADIEGTNGLCDWKETTKGNGEYSYFAERMSREVAAVCRGAAAAGAEEIIVRDAHDSARNIDHGLLPLNACLRRGWSGSPLQMLDGIDAGKFDGAIFTGYHSHGRCGGNPVGHAMDTRFSHIQINGLIASEFLINYYAALYCHVPVVMVSGDERLCLSVKDMDENIHTVVTFRGEGGSVTSPHPEISLRQLEETAAAAVKDKSKMKLALPKSFQTEISFIRHSDAYKAGFYPGASRINENTIGFNTREYSKFLTFLLFIS